MVSLQMAGAIPHERPHAIPDLDTGIGQRMSQLMGSIAGFDVGLPANTGLGGGNDLFVWGNPRPSIQYVG